MIAWLKGTIVHIEGNEIVLNCNNVGYRILLGGNLHQSLQLKIDDEKEFVVYTSVKEDELRLFGFSSFLARRVFTILLTVNGVGPKAAMNIVDQVSTEQIVLSIRQNNYEPFLRVSGIGKKTAQRIVLDLQGKIKNIELDSVYSQNIKDIADQTDGANAKSDLIVDAKSALMNLGFHEKEVRGVVSKHLEDTTDLDELSRRC